MKKALMTGLLSTLVATISIASVEAEQVTERLENAFQKYNSMQSLDASQFLGRNHNTESFRSVVFKTLKEQDVKVARLETDSEIELFIAGRSCLVKVTQVKGAESEYEITIAQTSKGIYHPILEVEGHGFANIRGAGLHKNQLDATKVQTYRNGFKAGNGRNLVEVSFRQDGTIQSVKTRRVEWYKVCTASGFAQWMGECDSKVIFPEETASCRL